MFASSRRTSPDRSAKQPEPSAPAKGKATQQDVGSPDGALSAQSTMGNGAIQEQMGQGNEEASLLDDEQESANGPFHSPLLNAALSDAFGADLAGLSATMGEDEDNAALGANATTEGKDMSFGAGVDEDMADGEAMEIVAHETAHALAGGGSGETALDQEGDAGEQVADEAGKEFRRWAESGFQGPSPDLKPAAGGRAEIHRHSDNNGAVTGSPMLRNGSTGALVHSLQHLLELHGYDLVIDGIFGKKTEAAVRSFQKKKGLSVDGIVGPNTAKALNSTSASSGSSSGGSSTGSAVTGSPLLKKGSTGSLVKELQQLLNDKGASLTTDGIFGSKTDSAVRSFQSANGLTVDGVVGPNTAAKLNGSGSKDVGSSTPASPSGSTSGSSESAVRDEVMKAAESHLGKPYYWGADGPSMFDCSGFILYVLRQDTGLVNWGDDTAHGIKGRVPKTSVPEKGDLIFYSSGGRVGHVEMYTGKGSTEIGASGGGSSTFGNDPGAKVQYGNMNSDSRARSYGTIDDLIAARLAKK